MKIKTTQPLHFYFIHPLNCFRFLNYDYRIMVRWLRLVVAFARLETLQQLNRVSWKTIYKSRYSVLVRTVSTNVYVHLWTRSLTAASAPNSLKWLFRIVMVLFLQLHWITTQKLSNNEISIFECLNEMRNVWHVSYCVRSYLL